MKKINILLLSSCFILLLPAANAMINDDTNSSQNQGVRKKQTFKDVCPGISLETKGHIRIVKFENGITLPSKNNFSKLINDSEKFLEFFKHRYVKFLGLNDESIEFVQSAFPKLMENNVHCIIPCCQKDSQLDQFLHSYYLRDPQHISAYTDDEVTVTDWIANSDHYNAMLDLIEEPEFDFSPINVGKEDRDYQRTINTNTRKGADPSSSDEE